MSGDPSGRLSRRRHRRGDHRDAVAHPRLHRHRAQLRLCLRGQAGRCARHRPRARRPLRAGRQPAQGRRPRAGDGAAHRRASGAHLWADRYDGVVDNIFDFEDQIAEQRRRAPCTRRSAPPRSSARQRSGLRTSPPTTWCCSALPHLWAHRRADNAEAIRLLDEARRTRSGLCARDGACAAWARAQHVVYNWTSDIADGCGPRARADRAGGGRAVNDDPTALTALATAMMLLLGDLDRAQTFRRPRAGARSATTPGRWTRRGFLNVYRGEPEPASACFERAHPPEPARSLRLQ